MTNPLDVIVIGGGQAGLAVAWYLRRASLRFVVLDNAAAPGGAWRQAWDSLRLFSPAQFSSLPGWQMPKAKAGDYPTRDEVIDYLARYEQRYGLPVQRPVAVSAVTQAAGRFTVTADAGTWTAPLVISATGTWSAPFVPPVPAAPVLPGSRSIQRITAPRPGSPDRPCLSSAAAIRARRFRPSCPNLPTAPG